MRISPRSVASFALLCAVSMSAQAADAQENWGQWRGPLGTGVAPKADPPLKWSDTEGVKWKVKIPGRGTSTPIIWDDQIFIQTAIPTGKKIADYTATTAGPVL